MSAVTPADLAATADRDPVTYEAGWDSSAAVQTTVIGVMPTVWWLLIGGPFEILFGGMYLGTPQETHINLTPAWFSLVSVVVGVAMVTIAFGALRLERWAYWAGWLFNLALTAFSVDVIVRWAQGTPITAEIVFFAGLNLLFVLYNVYFLTQPTTRQAVHFGIFRGSPISPGMALCGLAIAIPSLTVTLVVQHIDKHLSQPTLLVIYLLGSVLVMVMAFRGVKGRPWVWWADCVWALILAGLSLYVIAHQMDHMIRGTSLDTQGLIFAGVNLVFLAIAVFILFLDEIRGAILGGVQRKQALFSPKTLIGGVTLAVLAGAIYLLEGFFGTPAISYTVFGLVMGTIVGLLPGADVANRISGYFAGLFLAFASYVARGGLLPYTKGSAALVVFVMLLLVTGVTAVVRSRAWFVLLLLGVGTMYGLVEPLFQAAPAAYLATAGLALVGILLGLFVGFTVSSLLPLELVPYKGSVAVAAQTTTNSSSASNQPTHSSVTDESTHDGTKAKEDGR